MTSTAGANSSKPAATAAARGRWRAWAIWGVASLFYLIAYFIRVSPAVMTQELMRSFGILVDSWGGRRLLVWGALATAVGSLAFGITSHFALAFLARMLIGAATAVAWIVSLKLITHWFPARRFAMISGLTLMLGNLGALVAQVPLRLLVARFAWRPVTVASGV